MKIQPGWVMPTDRKIVRRDGLVIVIWLDKDAK